MNAETDPHRSRSKPALPVILELAQEHRKTKGQRGQSGQRARVSGGGNSSRHPMQSQLVQGSMRQPHQAEAQDQRSRAQRLLPAHNKLVFLETPSYPSGRLRLRHPDLSFDFDDCNTASIKRGLGVHNPCTTFVLAHSPSAMIHGPWATAQIVVLPSPMV